MEEVVKVYFNKAGLSRHWGDFFHQLLIDWLISNLTVIFPPHSQHPPPFGGLHSPLYDSRQPQGNLKPVLLWKVCWARNYWGWQKGRQDGWWKSGVYDALWWRYCSYCSKSLQMVTTAMKLILLLLGRKAMTNLDSILKSRDITLPTKVCLVKAMVFPVVTYRCESWTIKKVECRRTDAFKLVLEKTLESSLDSKDIKPVNPKGNQPWIFIGKDADAGKDWA